MHSKQVNYMRALFSGAALSGIRTHDTLQSRLSALPAELPGQL